MEKVPEGVYCNELVSLNGNGGICRFPQDASLMRNTLLIWTVVCFCTTSAWADTELTRGPYLQQGAPTEMTLIWRTHRPSNPAVRFGPVAGEAGQRVDGEAVVIRVSPDSKEPTDLPRLHSAPPGTYQYEARLTGLEPDTRYYYEVLDGSQVLISGPEYYFETSPQKGYAAPTGIWVVGDSGTGGAEAASVYKSMREYTALKSYAVDLMLHLGDMAYGSGQDHEFQRNFFDLYQPTLRNTVCWPTMGNHEGRTSNGETGIGPYFDAYVVPMHGESGGIPSGTESYYSFDYGRIHFIVLNSYDMDRRPDKPMAQWLKRDLAALKDTDWIVAFCHHPPYTMGTHNSDTEREHREIREHIMPILEEGGVDLVLGGHSHIYERSMLIDGAYATPTRAEGVVLDDGDGSPDGDGPYRKSAGINGREGVVAIVAGNGGASIRQKGTMPVMKKSIVKFGSNLLSFNGDTMDGAMLGTKGDLLDTFRIVKKGKVTPLHIGHPWQPLRPPEIEPVMPGFAGSVTVTLRSPTQLPF
jgi:hypothetical protein